MPSVTLDRADYYLLSSEFFAE